MNFEQGSLFARRADPATSKEAARTRSRKIQPVHYFVLEHHASCPDSDANAGQAAFLAQQCKTQEEGRRASRTIREDLGWIEIDHDPNTGKPVTVRNLTSGKSGMRNRVNATGREVLASRNCQHQRCCP